MRQPPRIYERAINFCHDRRERHISGLARASKPPPAVANARAENTCLCALAERQRDEAHMGKTIRCAITPARDCPTTIGRVMYTCTSNRGYAPRSGMMVETNNDGYVVSRCVYSLCGDIHIHTAAHAQAETEMYIRATFREVYVARVACMAPDVCTRTRIRISRGRRCPADENSQPGMARRDAFSEIYARAVAGHFAVVRAACFMIGEKKERKNME